MDNQKLSARVEALEGPSREVDREIALAKGWTQISKDWFCPPNLNVHHHLSELPRFSACLNAAMSLVPEGCALQVQQRRSHEYFYAYLRDARQHEGWSAKNDNLALALCAAALKARGL